MTDQAEEIVKKCISTVSDRLRDAFDDEIASALLDRACPVCSHRCSYQYDEMTISNMISCQNTSCNHKFEIVACRAFECQVHFIPYSSSNLCPYHIRKNGIAFRITKVLDVLGKVIVPELFNDAVSQYVEIRMKQHAQQTHCDSDEDSDNESIASSHVSHVSHKSHVSHVSHQSKNITKTTKNQSLTGDSSGNGYLSKTVGKYPDHTCKSPIASKGNSDCGRQCTVEVIMPDRSIEYFCGLHAKKFK